MDETLTLQTVPHGSPRYQEAVAFRDRLLRAPLGLAFTAQQLAEEDTDIHLVALWGERLVGCLVLTPYEPDTLKMRQVAVEPAYQRQGIGTRLVAFSEEIARQEGYRRLILSARETAVSFYLRLGYAVIGEPFIEVTIPHRTMLKTLS